MKEKRILRNAYVFFVSLLILCASTLAVSAAETGADPGADPDLNDDVGLTAVTMGSIIPQVTETGKISLSVDGLGVYSGNTGIIQVEKPAGATVKSAYMAAATTGFTGYHLANGAIKINGADVIWNIETPSSISSFNYWSDVTSIVKPIVDDAPAGRINLNIVEVAPTYYIDGEILVVIFDDPNQATDNTIILLFGAQNVLGDTFHVGLADPIDTTDPELALDMSLGISYGWQVSGVQYSIVNVNNQRLTTSAGGEDDGSSTNGALLTVGGLDDSNVNPTNPEATPANARTDDELYNLLPFVKSGDTSIHVYTQNPSNDDNIFFSAFYLKSATAVIGEGIILSPASAVNLVGTEHTVVATVQDDDGNPVVGREVTFNIISGPNAGLSGIAMTDASGKATFSYTGNTAGTDVIEASCLDSKGNLMTSNQATKDWTIDTEVPEFPTIALPVVSILGLMFIFQRRKE